MISFLPRLDTEPGDHRRRYYGKHRDHRGDVTHTGSSPGVNGKAADDRAQTDAGVRSRYVQCSRQRLCMRGCRHHTDLADRIERGVSDTPDPECNAKPEAVTYGSHARTHADG